MLKPSPVLTSSANKSPTSFRYAPALPHAAHAKTHAHTHDQTSVFTTAPADEGPIPRRSSSRSASSASPSITARSRSRSSLKADSTGASASMKSPSPAASRSVRNLTLNDSTPSGGVAAAAAEAASSPRDVASVAQQIPNGQPPHSSPQPRAMTGQPAATATTTANTTITTANEIRVPFSHNHTSDSQLEQQATDTLSPNKRRGSPGIIPQPEPLPGHAEPTNQNASQTSKRPRAEESPPKVLPTKYEFCAVEDIVELISHMIGELITTNDAIRPSNGGLTRFHSRTPPGISVRDYLHRLARHATLTPPLLLAMVYYIDRLCLMYQQFTINTLTVHRFLITAATVAAKGLSDAFWNNATYARVGGVRLAELKLLELEFLHRVDWKIVPNPEVLVAYYCGLVERTPGYVLESEGSSDEELEEDGSEE